MKPLLLSVLLLTLCVGTLSAQNRASHDEDCYHPSVHVFSSTALDSLLLRGGKTEDIICCREISAENITRAYDECHRGGFGQFHKPNLIFTTANTKFSFALGGFVRVKGAYDFDGISDDKSFVPYTISVPATYNSRQKFYFDGTGTRFFTKAIAHSRRLGRVVMLIEMDFNGGARGSYTPHMRSGYVHLLGLTIGRDVTTFCDLNSVPTTIDSQGPNCYNFNFTTLIRYQRQFLDRHLKVGIALEQPILTATYNDNFAALHQRMPDIPTFVEYAWGKCRDNHLRLSGVVNMYVRHLGAKCNRSLWGWGVQLRFTPKHGSATRPRQPHQYDDTIQLLKRGQAWKFHSACIHRMQKNVIFVQRVEFSKSTYHEEIIIFDHLSVAVFCSHDGVVFAESPEQAQFVR